MARRTENQYLRGLRIQYDRTYANFQAARRSGNTEVARQLSDRLDRLDAQIDREQRAPRMGESQPVARTGNTRNRGSRLLFDNQGRRVGSLAPASYATRTGNTRLVTAGARGTRRGITISQESLDAFRRRRTATEQGLNAK